MSKVFIYTAIRVQSEEADLHGGHVTTSFTEVNCKLPRIYLPEVRSIVKVRSVEHWEQAGVIVAVLEDSPAILAEYKRLRDIGLKYEYQYRPHVTVAYTKDPAELATFAHLVGVEVYLHGCYVGTHIKE